MKPLFALHRCGLLVLCMFAIAGCAAEPPSAGAAPAVVQVMVRLSPQAAQFDAERVAREASNAAGVPVRYGAAMGPRWHSLVLSCPDEAACSAALLRLAGDVSHFDAVERDQPRQVPR